VERQVWPNSALMAGCATLLDGPASMTKIAWVGRIQSPNSLRCKQFLFHTGKQLLTLPRLEQLGSYRQGDKRIGTNRSVHPGIRSVQMSTEAIERKVRLVAPEARSEARRKARFVGSGLVGKLRITGRLAQL